jgi:hypothetical protein
MGAWTTTLWAGDSPRHRVCPRLLAAGADQGCLTLHAPASEAQPPRAERESHGPYLTFTRLLGSIVIAVLCIASPAFAQMDGLTHHGVPDFCASPDKTGSTGNWSTAGTWSPSGVPGASSIIVIPNGVTVTYNANDSSTSIEAICIESGGTLDFGASGTLALLVGTLVVEEGGTLKIGDYDTSSPFTGTALIKFDGSYFSTLSANTASLDPAQWNTGLIVAGKIRTYGVAYDVCVRTNDAAINDTDTTISIPSTISGWASGETVIIPESRQRQGNEEKDGGTPESESRTLNGAVSGTTVTLSSGLTYDHPPGYAADGTTVWKYPIICNVSGHNIIFTSNTPAGTRGHSIYLHRADVGIRNTSYIDMGRTLIDDLHCSLRTTGTVDSTTNCTEGTGAWTRVGTNQKGRYAVHFHHTFGPADPGNTATDRATIAADPQVSFIGNLVYNGTKWPLTLHNTSYALLQNNAVIECDGPCIMAEDGNEHYNVLDGNTLCVIRSEWAARGFDGTGGATGSGAREAAGVWFMNGGGTNFVVNNVVCAAHNDGGNIVSEVGYKFYSPDGSAGTVKIPSFHGADLNDSDEYTTINPREIEIPDGNVEDNECYALSNCLTIWHINSRGTGAGQIYEGYGRSYINGMMSWNISEWGYLAYPSAGITFNNWTHSCTSTALRTDGRLAAVTGLYTPSDYMEYDYVIDGAQVWNCNSGVGLYAVPLMTVRNSYFKTDIGIYVNAYDSGAGGASPPGWPAGPGGEGQDPGTATRVLTLSSNTFADRYNSPWSHQPFALDYLPGYSTAFEELPETIAVTGYGGQSFELYYLDQDTEADHGGLAPCADTTTFPSISAIVCNIRSDSAGGNRKPRRIPTLRRIR